ncbi:hypothetical protein [Mangrovimonas spongiae]|uniref:Uncharacterized protein n=1 Tax=Mangrovimonas spongiae TaxID=2494697 RepID=A0A3R9NRA5_9FLAO|nr:hypothetical protein [Mangrovimonas spongiae]RSK41776.1 hypothetical protein EJA19_02535 [Mangrovimonas spongiae]
MGCKSQPATNELTQEQFDNIRIDGILKLDIEQTNGDVEEMASLFGTPQSMVDKGVEIGEHTRKFVYVNNSCIVFNGLSSNLTTPSISYFNVNSITINNQTASIGDNINVLGDDIIMNENVDGTQSIIFSLFDYDGFSIIIEFDQSSDLITKIEYFVWT